MTGFIYPIEPMIEALRHFDETKPQRDKMFNAIKDNRDFDEWESAEAAALEKLQQAFYEFTKDRNSRSNCMIAEPTFIRNVVKTALENQ